VDPVHCGVSRLAEILPASLGNGDQEIHRAEALPGVSQEGLVGSQLFGTLRVFPVEIDAVESVFSAEGHQFCHQLFAEVRLGGHPGETLRTIPPAHAEEETTTGDTFDLLELLQDGGSDGWLGQPPVRWWSQTKINEVGERLERFRDHLCHPVVGQIARHHE